MPIELKLYAPAETPLVEGPIRLTSWLRNSGTDTIQAPTARDFLYRVFDEEDSKLISTASVTAKEDSIPRLVAIPVSLPPSIPLAADGMYAYPVDLTELLIEPLRRGRYQVEATLRSGDGASAASNRVAFEVVVSRPMAYSQTLDGGRERLVIVEFHEHQDGTVVLRHRHSGTKLLDQFYNIHSFKPAAARIEQTALAVEAGARVPPNWRWVAWLDGASLHCGVARKQDFLYPNGPIDIGLESPRLLPHGYMQSDGSGTFLVTGLSEGGQRKIRMITIPPGAEATASLVDLHLGTVPQDAIPDATMVCPLEGRRELVLYWVLPMAGVHAVAQGRFDGITGEMLARPERVFQTSREIVAAQAPPVINFGAEDAYQILLGPEKNGGPFTLASVGRTPVDLPSLSELPEGARVARWVLSANCVTGGRIVALVTGSGQIWTTSEGRQWRQIGEGDVDLSSVGLWVFDARLVVCTWFERDFGYRIVQL